MSLGKRGLQLAFLHRKSFMTQNQAATLEVIPVDYDLYELPTAVKFFKPTLFKSGPAYFCLLGDNAKDGILGIGDTPKDALMSWEKHFNTQLVTRLNDDKIVRYVRRRLGDMPAVRAS